MTTFGVEDVRAEGLGFGHSGLMDCGLKLKVRLTGSGLSAEEA